MAKSGNYARAVMGGFGPSWWGNSAGPTPRHPETSQRSRSLKGRTWAADTHPIRRRDNRGEDDLESAAGRGIIVGIPHFYRDSFPKRR